MSPRAAIKACLVHSWPQHTSFMNGIFVLGGTVSLLTLDLKHVLPMFGARLSAVWVKSAWWQSLNCKSHCTLATWTESLHPCPSNANTYTHGAFDVTQFESSPAPFLLYSVQCHLKFRYLGNTLQWLRQAKSKKKAKRQTSSRGNWAGWNAAQNLVMLLPALQLVQCPSGALCLPFLSPLSPSIDQLSPCSNCQEHWGETEFELTRKSQGEQAPTLGMDPVEPLKIF